MSGFRSDFSSDQENNFLNGFFTSTGIKKIPGGKDYCAVSAVFSFQAAFIDRSMGYSKSSVLTTIRTRYSEIVNALLFEACSLNAHGKLILSVLEKVEVLKRDSKHLFGDLEDLNFFSQKFYILDRAVVYVARYGDLNFVDASAFEHLTFVVKKYFRMKSMRTERIFDETVRIINSSYKESEMLLASQFLC